MTFDRFRRFGRLEHLRLRPERRFAKLKSAVEKGLSKAGLMLFVQLDPGAVVRKETRDDKKNRDRAVQSDHFQAV